MSARRFDCQDVDRLLDLEDLALRPDRKALAGHLATCPRCRELAPELEWLYGKLEAREVSVGTSWTLRAAAIAAALVVIAVTLVTVGRDGATTTVRPTTPAAVLPAAPRLLPAHHSHFETEVIRLLPEQENRSSSSSMTLSPAAMSERAAAPMEWAR